MPATAAAAGGAGCEEINGFLRLFRYATVRPAENTWVPPVQVDPDGARTAARLTSHERRVRAFYVTARRRQTPVIIFSESVGGIVSRPCDDSEAYPSRSDRALHDGAGRGADHAKVNCAGFLARASASWKLAPPKPGATLTIASPPTIRAYPRATGR